MTSIAARFHRRKDQSKVKTTHTHDLRINALSVFIEVWSRREERE